MKKFLLAVSVAALMANTFTVASAAERMVPDTDQISPRVHLKVVGRGDSAKPVWISENPELHSEQKLTTGVYVTHLDEATGELSVTRDGEKVSSYNPAR